MYRLFWATLLASIASGLTFAQAQQDGAAAVREKPEDYAKTVKIAGNRTLAADYLARSAPASGGVFFARNHLVVEVAIFGSGGAGSTITVDPSHFQLQLTGGRGTPKKALQHDPASLVAATMREGSLYDANQGTLEASGSVNNTGVILGRRRPTIGAPDIDQRLPRRGSDPPVKGGPSHDRSGNAPAEVLKPEEALEKAALAKGEYKTPLRGLLFFPYDGKLKSLQSITLLYQAGEKTTPVELKLLP